jgi:ferredoxin--NADP+ reductase
LIAQRQPRAVDYEGWKAIDVHERSLAKGHDRPRVKLVDIREMLDVAERSRGER